MLEQYADPITTNDDIKNRLNDFHHIHGRCFHLHDHVLRVNIIINIKNITHLLHFLSRESSKTVFNLIKGRPLQEG